MFQIGAGEIKQAKPYGHKRSQALSRMEDLLKAWSEWTAHPDRPLSMEGNHWSLKNASLGGARQFPPEIWALGGGPKLVDIATSYADGFCTMSPFAWADTETIATNIKSMKVELEKKGRDPEAFGFGTWVMCQIHEDDDLIAQSLDNQLTRWMTAAFGRLHQPDWRKEGLEPIFPDDWHYALKLLPVEWDAASAKEITDKVTPEMGRKAWLNGSPRKVASQIQEYIDAGMNWILVGDFLPFVVPPSDPAQAIAPSAEVCSILRANAGL
jgi:phthiodiolone/phenolphthiodiolone dimycocerosates ketoreductase